MIDNKYRNSFKEVYTILENTDKTLVNKIPIKFINFIKDNMNTSYEININPNINIDQQLLLKETEAILSLIYRNYWATPTEKQEFDIKDKQEYIETEKMKKELYQGKDIYEIFRKRKNIQKIEFDDKLMVIKKENFFKKFFKKILSKFNL